ncbi:hypothetical protein [Desulfospira joergensenii]|uniref:hypothetical protein n=1 Tax=Desulfospira joergensenii TaxID=53329 RepID=UPI0003B5F420|nr:hypothetical protein [Desulfospira joergensenii]
MQVYWASVEFDIVHPEEYENCVGGFAYLFLKAADDRDAREKIKAAVEDEFRLIQIEFVGPYDGAWESMEEQRLYDGLANRAENSEGVVWDEIDAYEFKDE